MKMLTSFVMGAAIYLVMVPAWALFAVAYLCAPKAVWRAYTGRS